MFTRSYRVVTAAATMLLTAFAATAAPTRTASEKVTVGEFAVKITRALGYPVDDPEAAGRTLRMAGVHLDADLDATLTAGRAADILRELGVRATTGPDPGAPMSSAAASRVATTVALEVTAAGPEVSVEPATEQCTSLGDRMACYNCCVNMLLPQTRYPIIAILICGFVCTAVYPPSPSTPTP